MEIEKTKAIIESMLFAAGRPVDIADISNVLEIKVEDIKRIIDNMISEFSSQNRGIEIIAINNSYQLCTKKEFYEYIYPLFDNRNKPNLSSAALETLSIIAYNPRITRAEIEQLRGVSSDAMIYKLLEYNLIEDSGRSEAPGKPMTYKTTNEFLRLFGVSSLDELPELPRYKLDENEQIVIEDFEESEKEDIKISSELEQEESVGNVDENKEEVIEGQERIEGDV